MAWIRVHLIFFVMISPFVYRCVSYSTTCADTLKEKIRLFGSIIKPSSPVLYLLQCPSLHSVESLDSRALPFAFLIRTLKNIPSIRKLLLHPQPGQKVTIMTSIMPPPPPPSPQHVACHLQRVLYFASTLSRELGSPCSRDSQCKVKDSHCSAGVCTCKHYHAQLGATECLESKLLGRECVISEQCSLRVANSTCTNGHCHCSEGFVRFRKHTCLGPAKVGDVCYSDEHCQLWARNSHCKFLIPKLFGKCICDGEGNCAPDEPTTATEEPQTNSTTETPVESPNEGNEEIPESPSEDNDKPEKANAPFVDPFLHQKEHLQEPAVVTEVTTTAVEDTRNEEESTEGIEASTTESDVQEVSSEGSKYRVEVSEKDTNGSEWADVVAVSLGYPCRSDAECQKSDGGSVCIDGFCDCAVSSDSCGREKTGCGPETFQCRDSGLCISWFFVCDGRSDCPDSSDEECAGPKCPSSSFQCGTTGPCISLAAICDGVKNCPNGEDERLCSPRDRNSTEGCPKDTFQCANGQCLPKFEFCNAIPKCSDGSDEFSHLCSSQSNKKTVQKKREYCPFECGNGRCRSTAIVCSGRDGCGDNSDEAHCSVCRCPKTAAGN